VRPDFTATARRLGLVCAIATASLNVLYLVPLLAGFLTLPSPEAPIGDPWFSIMEVLIMLTTPFMVGLTVAVHAWSRPELKVYGSVAVVFMAMMTALTSSNHFVILTVARRPEFTALPWGPAFVGFDWLSVTYSLDILAWDVFFALAVLSQALVFRGGGLTRFIRVLLLVSGIVAFVGLGGVVVDRVAVRNIGIIGYAGVYTVSAVLLGLLFKRTPPSPPAEDVDRLG